MEQHSPGLTPNNNNRRRRAIVFGGLGLAAAATYKLWSHNNESTSAGNNSQHDRQKPGKNEAQPNPLNTTARIKQYERDVLSKNIDFQVCDEVRHSIKHTIPPKVPEDRTMTIVIDVKGKRYSAQIPILIKDTDPSRDERKSGKLFTAKTDKGETIQLIIRSGHPNGIDVGVANKFIVYEPGYPDTQHKIYAVIRAPYSKSQERYSNKAIAYTPATPDYIKPENIRDGKAYVRFITSEAETLILKIVKPGKFADEL